MRQQEQQQQLIRTTRAAAGVRVSAAAQPLRTFVSSGTAMTKLRLRRLGLHRWHVLQGSAAHIARVTKAHKVTEY